MGEVAYRLALLTSLKGVHNVFMYLCSKDMSGMRVTYWITQS